MSMSLLQALERRAADAGLAASIAHPPPQQSTAAARSGRRAPLGFNRMAAPAPSAPPRTAHAPKIKAGLIPRSTWRPAQPSAPEAEEELPDLEPAMKISIPTRPVLHDAAKDGDAAALMRALDEAGCDVDSKYLGQGALHLAAKGGHSEAVALLLDRGASLHATSTNTGNKNSGVVWDMGGTTALHGAAEMNQTDVIALLLDRSADLHARANGGDTALHMAAREGHLKATKLLVARSADVHATNKLGHTALDEALELGGGKCPCEDLSDRQWGAVGAFLEQVAEMPADFRVEYAQRVWELPVAAMMHDAAEQGDLLQLRRLLDYGCAVNARDYDGTAAIHAAAEGGHREAIALLLDRRADVRATNNYEDTPLHVAAREGHRDASALLVARGADAHAANKFGRTPLDMARRSQTREWEAVAALLQEEMRDVAELAPGDRALRKIRAAMLQQQRESPRPNG